MEASNTTQTAASDSPVVWFEVMGQDSARLRAFFGELFGWRLRALDGMDYSVKDGCAGEGISGGVGHSPHGASWATFYVRVPEIHAAVARASALGGRTIMPVTRLPDGMDIAVITDPEGHPIGLVGPAPKA